MRRREIIKMVALQIAFFLLGVLLVAVIHSGWLEMLPKCIFHDKYNFICPTCGATRCVIQFLDFNFIASFGYHPIIFCVMLYAIIIDIVYIINVIWKKNFLKFLYPSTKIVYFFIILFVIQYFVRIIMWCTHTGLTYL